MSPLRQRSDGAIVVDALVGASLELQRHVLVEWSNGVITRVAPRAEAGEAAEGIPELRGVLIPGLIDAHVHLCMSGSADVVSTLTSQTDPELTDLVAAHARAYTECGITTVRDLGSRDALVVHMNASGMFSEATMPTVIPALAISAPEGHGNFLSRWASTLDDYRSIIDETDPAKAPYLKLFASGGVITGGTDPSGVQMSADLLERVVAYSHEQGFRIAAHAHSAASILNCLRADVDTIEHFSYLDEAMLDEVDRSSATLVSTFVATHRFCAHPERDKAEPEALRKILAHLTHEQRALTCASGIPDRVVGGSDSGTIFNPHPQGLLEQAQLMEMAGFSRRDVLMSLTVRAAAVLGVPTGRIEPGYTADFILVRENPLTSLAALFSPHSVFVRGVEVTG